VENRQEEIYSKRVRAGKRTYFFDVKATRAEDYYLTSTESKKRFNEDGFTYEKHKIFLYKEDFNKFVAALDECVTHVKEELLPDFDFEQFDRDGEDENYKANVEKTDVDADKPKLDSELSWE
jgi:hypothetical protein